MWPLCHSIGIISREVSCCEPRLMLRCDYNTYSLVDTCYFDKPAFRPKLQVRFLYLVHYDYMNFGAYIDIGLSTNLPLDKHSLSAAILFSCLLPCQMFESASMKGGRDIQGFFSSCVFFLCVGQKFVKTWIYVTFLGFGPGPVDDHHFQLVICY